MIQRVSSGSFSTSLSAKHRHLHLILSFLVLSALLVTLFPTSVIIPTPQVSPIPEQITQDPPAFISSPNASAANTYTPPESLIGKPEILTARTSHSATFDLGDGRYAAVHESSPIHYQAENGSWQLIDPAFVALPNGWQNITNLLQTSLAQRNSNAKVGTLAAGVGWQPEALLAVDQNNQVVVLSQPLPEGNASPGLLLAGGQTVRYPQGWSESVIQDQWQSSPGRSEYTMRLSALPRAQGIRPRNLDMRIFLRLRPGTSIQVDGKPVALPLETREPLVFVGSNSEEFRLLPPSAYEQARISQMSQGSYLLNATTDPSVIELRVRFPWQWLAAKERQFPVILDPIFQVRSPIQLRSAAYVEGRFIGSRDSFLLLGPMLNTYHRLLVKFDLPQLAPGSVIDRAFMVAAPSRALNGSWFNDQPIAGYPEVDIKTSLAQAYQLTNGNWLASASAQPLPSANPLKTEFGDTEASMAWSRGRGAINESWDVTDLARIWLPQNNGSFIPPLNNGLMIRVEENCSINNWNCGQFLFDPPPSTWTDKDLASSEVLSTPDNPWLNFSERGKSGVRLMVFYSGPTLTDGQVIRSALPSNDANYFQSTRPLSTTNIHAAHEYRVQLGVEDAPSPWRAVVARGLGPVVGVETPIEEGDTRLQPLQDTLRLQIRDATDRIIEGKPPEIRNGFPYSLPDPAPSGNVTYAILPSIGSSRSYRVRVLPTQSSPTPLTYDIRLIRQQPQILDNNQGQPLPESGRTSIISQTLDSADPMLLLNLRLPLGSNSRIDVSIPSNTVQRFAADLYAGSEATLVRALEYSYSPDGLGAQRLISPVFSVQTTNFALAVTNSGPEEDFVPPPNNVIKRLSADEVTQAIEVLHTSYTVTVRVTSCPSTINGFPAIPTPGGGCQIVQCPALTTPYRAEQGFGIWSPAGFTGETTNIGSAAALIGAANGSAPTVAIVGGRAGPNGQGWGIDGGPANAQAGVLLIQCPAPAENPQPPTAFFDAFLGQMERQERDGVPILTPRPVSYSYFFNPWQGADAQDLESLFLAIDPAAGTAAGSATLRRTLENAGGSTSTFNVRWALNVGGWSTLSSTVTATQTAQATVASLGLALGTQFSLDLKPDGARQVVVAIRARAAAATQDARLGGASRPVQALIGPRGLGVAGAPQVCGNGSCVDLRALDDTPSSPNRTWAMPDVHLQENAGLVALNMPGSFHVYSADYPLAQGSGITQEFSYDAFNAKVSVTEEKCDKTDEETVTVIRGETEITLPNIGDGTTPGGSIASSFKLCQTSLRNVRMEFTSSVGIPIGNSGLFMTGLSGEVALMPTYTTITVGVDFQAAPGGDGGILKVRGEVIIDTRGLFAFQGSGSVLKGIMGAEGALWVAWSPLDIGFRMSIQYPFTDPWLTGMARAHLWQGQGWQNRYSWLPDNDETHIAAQIGAEIKIKKGQIFSWWFIDIPPGDTELGIDLAFGQFCTNSSCTKYEWGVKGKLTILDYDIGLYYGFDHGFDFILGNDDHILIDQYGGATDIPFGTQQSLNSLATRPTIQRAPKANSDGTILVPIRIQPTSRQILFGLGWQAGTPRLTLIDPAGFEITPENALQYTATFTATAQNILIGVRNPVPGQWQAKISNLSAEGIEHYKFIYFANKGAPVEPGSNPFIKPSLPSEEGTGSYRLTWQVPVGVPTQSTISLFYSTTTPITGNLELGVPIVQNLPFAEGQYAWNTTGIANGTYQVYAVVDDGVNSLVGERISDTTNTCLVGAELPPARAFAPERFPGTAVFTATGTININDTTPPEMPAGLSLTPADGALFARWDGPTTQDIVAYEVSWGPLFEGAGISAPGSVRVTATERPTYRIGGLNNNIRFGVQVAAIDVNGRTGPATPVIGEVPTETAQPLPSAPTAFTITQVLANRASFAWQAATGLAPASYRLVYRSMEQDSAVRELETTSTTASIAGLNPGKTYDVTVNAVSAAGWQSASTEPIRFVATDGIDSDGDGLPDDWAQAFGINGADRDSDQDGLTNGDELLLGSNPTLQSSDGDAFSDFEELQQATDPLDPASFGAALLQPRLTLQQDQVTFRLKLQSDAPNPAAEIGLSNTGGGTLRIQAVSDSQWLKATVVSDTVRFEIDQHRMEPGYHTGVVRLVPISGSDHLIGPPSCVRVEVWASPPDSGFTYNRFLPIVAAASASPVDPLPDIIGSIALDPDKQSFTAGEPVQITVTFTNTGAVASGPFWSDLYINPSTPPTSPNVRWNEVCGLQPCFGLAWFVDKGLAPGESITLTSTVGSYADGQTIWPGWFASGTTDVYLYVDSWRPGVAYGAVRENDETNNLARIRGLRVTGINPLRSTTQQAIHLPPRSIDSGR